ncbi:MAG: hypothetical protein ACRDD7_07570 [Peptostreptococcaceae bacterium]
MENKKINNDKSIDTREVEYQNSVHKLGRISTLIVIALIVAVPLTMTIVTGVKIDVSKMMVALSSLLMVFGIVGVTEVLSYAPILGSGATYLSFVTGNIGNMKLPAATNAMNIAEVEPGTKEAEVISILAIGASSVVTTTVVFIGLLFLGQLSPILENPILKPGLDNMMPALMGAFATPYIVGSFKTARVPLGLAMIVTVILGSESMNTYQSILLPLFIGVSVLSTHLNYKKGLKKAK